ncbi:MAG: DUF1491 family protein [Alphaproteobacteria bacterium]|nr:DUF1491 family protein [Alphaproteobacteria bacterium]
MMTSPPRLKTSVRVSAHARRARGEGAFATVARHGDDDAGAVIVKVFLGRGGDGAPRAIAHFESILDNGARGWRVALDGPAPEADVDAWIARQVDRDPDLWVLEIEDAGGRAFLID